MLEDNLMWSSKLVQALKGAGHEAVIAQSVPGDLASFGAAIVNLGSRAIDPSVVVPALKSGNVFVVGHAGHKEEMLQELGHSLGCDVVATNSQVAFKIKQILADAPDRTNNIEQTPLEIVQTID